MKSSKIKVFLNFNEETPLGNTIVPSLSTLEQPVVHASNNEDESDQSKVVESISGGLCSAPIKNNIINFDEMGLPTNTRVYQIKDHKNIRLTNLQHLDAATKEKMQ